MLALRTAAMKGSYRFWLTKSGQGRNPPLSAVTLTAQFVHAA
jgi:hypothetical protein